MGLLESTQARCRELSLFEIERGKLMLFNRIQKEKHSQLSSES